MFSSGHSGFRPFPDVVNRASMSLPDLRVEDGRPDRDLSCNRWDTKRDRSCDLLGEPSQTDGTGADQKNRGVHSVREFVEERSRLARLRERATRTSPDGGILAQPACWPQETCESRALSSRCPCRFPRSLQARVSRRYRCRDGKLVPWRRSSPGRSLVSCRRVLGGVDPQAARAMRPAPPPEFEAPTGDVVASLPFPRHCCCPLRFVGAALRRSLKLASDDGFSGHLVKTCRNQPSRDPSNESLIFRRMPYDVAMPLSEISTVASVQCICAAH